MKEYFRIILDPMQGVFYERNYIYYMERYVFSGYSAN
jgi:hypothetical protein